MPSLNFAACKLLIQLSDVPTCNEGDLSAISNFGLMHSNCPDCLTKDGLKKSPIPVGGTINLYCEYE